MMNYPIYENWYAIYRIDEKGIEYLVCAATTKNYAAYLLPDEHKNKEIKWRTLDFTIPSIRHFHKGVIQDER